MNRSGPVGRPRLRSRLRRLARWYAPEPLRRLYRSVRGRSVAGPRAREPIGPPRAEPAEPAEARGDRPIVIFTDRATRWLGSLLPAAYPDRRVIQVAGGTEADAHALLTAHGPYELIIDATTDPVADRLRRFRRTWFHLGEGGRYGLRTEESDPGDAGAADGVWRYVGRLVDHRDRPHSGDDAGLTRQERAIAESIRQAERTRETVLIVSARSALPKLGEGATGPLFAARPDLGSVVISKPGRTLGRADDHRSNRDRAAAWSGAGRRVPEVQLREYRDVLCCPHQVVIGRGVVLPDSFRHFTKARLRNRYLEDLSPWFARYAGDLSGPTELSGSYFHLSSEVPRHFGHLMTEQCPGCGPGRRPRSAIPT